jgi:hypothetical protein
MKETITVTLFFLQSKYNTLDNVKKVCIPMRTKLTIPVNLKKKWILHTHRLTSCHAQRTQDTNTPAPFLRFSEARLSYTLFRKSVTFLIVNLHRIRVHYSVFHFNSLRLTTSGKENSYNCGSCKTRR